MFQQWHATLDRIGQRIAFQWHIRDGDDAADKVNRTATVGSLDGIGDRSRGTWLSAECGYQDLQSRLVRQKAWNVIQNQRILWMFLQEIKQTSGGHPAATMGPKHFQAAQLLQDRVGFGGTGATNDITPVRYRSATPR